jgi:hypothetical protein
MKKIIQLMLFLTIVVGTTSQTGANTVKAKAVIGSYSWTSDCKCAQVGPGFGQYVAVSYCKGIANNFGCK